MLFYTLKISFWNLSFGTYCTPSLSQHLPGPRGTAAREADTEPRPVRFPSGGLQPGEGLGGGRVLDESENLETTICWLSGSWIWKQGWC